MPMIDNKQDNRYRETTLEWTNTQSKCIQDFAGQSKPDLAIEQAQQKSKGDSMVHMVVFHGQTELNVIKVFYRGQSRDYQALIKEFRDEEANAFHEYCSKRMRLNGFVGSLQG